MKRNILALTLFTAFFGSMAFAQQDKLITHFMYDKMSLNPGETGVDGGVGSICGVTMYRNQWDKVHGAPNSALLNIEANLGHINNALRGLGIAFYHDAIAFTRQNNLALNYSYHLDIAGGVLGIGAGLGMVNIGMNPNWIPPTNVVDYTLPTQFSSINFDANFGLYWKGPQDYYVGLSSTHLTAPDLKSDDLASSGFEAVYSSARHYYIMGGKKFNNIGTDGEVEANTILRTDLVKFSADINAKYIWRQMAYGGLSYRTSDAVIVMLGYKPMPNLTVGYAYDITINKLSSYSRGSHEVMVKYCYQLPPIPVKTSKHPRWL